MGFYEQDGDALLYRFNGQTVRLEPWGENSLRVRAVFMGEILDQPWALQPVEADTRGVENTSGNSAPASTITIAGKQASITNGDITAKLNCDFWGNDLCITYKNGAGKVLLSEVERCGSLGKKARHFIPKDGNHVRLKVSFKPNEGEKLYGMGQYQDGRLNLKGCTLELAQRNTQVTVPFCVSSEGYGFLWNNPAVGEVHFGLNVTEWEAELTQQMDYWITAGDSPAAIEHAYCKATGYAPMMPEYGLGFWQCKLRYVSQEQVLEVAREYVKRGIPLKGIVIDYYHWPRCGDWRFDEEYFPDPDAMVRELKEMGIETMVSIWPQVDWRSENYEEMQQKGLLVKANNGIDVQMLFHGNNVLMDPTNPRTQDYVWNKIRENYHKKGIQTFWLDEAEPGFTCGEFSPYRYHIGQAEEVANLYPRAYAEMICKGQKAAGQSEIMNLIRSAWAGSQKFGALVWSGDIFSTFEEFRRQIPAGINIGLAGIPWWNTDIGGFHGGDVRTEEFRELLLRWFAFGTFSPVMRLHGNRNPHTPVINNAGEEREPEGAPNEIWSYGEEACRIMTHYIEVRELMKDYIRDVMADAHEQGNPVMRSLFYEFPEDAKAWDVGDEYFFGPDLLVAPVMEAGATTRSVYLPEGAEYVLAHTGETFAGGQRVSVDAPIDTIPVFLRNGRQSYLVEKI